MDSVSYRSTDLFSLNVPLYVYTYMFIWSRLFSVKIFIDNT